MRKLETVNISKIKKENYQTITFASKQYLQKSPMVITLNGKYFHLKYPKGWNELKLFSISSITIIPEVPGRTFWQLSPSVRDRLLSGNAGSRKWIFTSSKICPCPCSDQSFWKVFQNLKSPHFSILGSELRP